MIVSFVQNIEYSLPWSGDCEEDKDEYLVKSTVDAGKDCYSNVAFGWFAPIEFIGNFTGDCDTRTVFLFTVLKHYKYDVVILNSSVYSHSILAINLLPTHTTSPIYKVHNRKRYYVVIISKINSSYSF